MISHHEPSNVTGELLSHFCPHKNKYFLKCNSCVYFPQLSWEQRKPLSTQECFPSAGKWCRVLFLLHSQHLLLSFPLLLQKVRGCWKHQLKSQLLTRLCAPLPRISCKPFLDPAANAFQNLWPAPALSETMPQYFNSRWEVRRERSMFYTSGTSALVNTWGCCWVGLPSTTLMTPIWFPEAPLFEDYVKGQLVWKQHILLCGIHQGEEERYYRRISSG